MASKTTVTKSNAAGSNKSAGKSMTGSKTNCMRGKSVQATSRIGSQWTEFAQDNCALSDQEIVSDVLGCQKSLVKLYGTALCESSCTQLRDIIGNHLSECAIDQYDAFLYMNERGMYPTDNAPAPKVTQAQKKFAKLEQKMR